MKKSNATKNNQIANPPLDLNIETTASDYLSEPLLKRPSESNLTDTNSSNEDSVSTNPPTQKSRNINLILAYTFIAFSARSLWNQSVLSAFVYLIKNDDPKFVGILTGIMGTTQLLSSFPAGILADKFRRDTMLKIASVIGAIAAICTFAAAQSLNFVFLGLALAIWGLFWGICNTSILAMFADSIEDGERTHYFTQRTILQYLGNASGPKVALIMFLNLGDKWTVQACSTVVGTGQLLSIPAILLLCFLKDEDVVNNDYGSDETICSNDELDEEANDQRSTLLEEPLLVNGSDVEDHNEDSTSTSSSGIFLYIIPERRAVPILITLADVTSGLAAGMSIRYFPIFFLENLKMSPEQVQIVFLTTTLLMAVMTRVTQFIGTTMGNLCTTIIFKCAGALLMMLMVVSYQKGFSPLFVCVLFVLRTSTINSTGALTKSLLMDSVPSSERAKWSALESVNMFGWAGSAAFGGFLVDWEGIEFNFYTTSTLQLVATLPYILLFIRSRRRN